MLFIKLAHSSVAIELLTFQKWKIPLLLLKRAVIIWGKEIYSLRKKDWFFGFCVYKNVSQEIALSI